MFNNVVLLIVAVILALILFPIGFIYAIFHLIFAHNTKESFKYISNFFRSIALSIDQLGNVVCQYLFNAVFIKRYGIKFGNEDETVSSVLGKNKNKGTLRFLGKTLDRLLNLFEEDHAVKAIQ